MLRRWTVVLGFALFACAPGSSVPAHEPEPLLNVPDRHVAQAAAAPTAARAPAPVHDQPERCLDNPPAYAAWDREVESRVDGALAKLGACTKGLRASGTVQFGLGFELQGESKRQSVFQSSVDDCDAVACLRRGLGAVHAPRVPADKEAAVSFHVALAPGRPPERTERPIAADTVGHCADPEEKRTGQLPPEQIQTLIRARYDQIRRCYERGLARDPNLRGRVTVRFVIGREGRVEHVKIASNSLPDCSVAQCVRDEIRACTFPKPEGGIVTVVYPIMLEPG